MIDFFYKKKKGGKRNSYRKGDKIRKARKFEVAKSYFFQKFFDKIIIREKKWKERNASCELTKERSREEETSRLSAIVFSDNRIRNGQKEASVALSDLDH